MWAYSYQWGKFANKIGPDCAWTGKKYETVAYSKATNSLIGHELTCSRNIFGNSPTWLKWINEKPSDEIFIWKSNDRICTIFSENIKFKKTYLNSLECIDIYRIVGRWNNGCIFSFESLMATKKVSIRWKLLLWWQSQVPNRIIKYRWYMLDMW